MTDLFTIHTHEQTAEGTAHVNRNAAKFSNNCKLIMQHFQKQNVPLTADYAYQWLGVRNAGQRFSDLRLKNGVIIISEWNKQLSCKTYRLGCNCPLPETTGCYLHDEKMKVK